MSLASRREALARFASVVALAGVGVVAGGNGGAAHAVAPNQKKPAEGYQLSGDYRDDAKRVLSSMRNVTELKRGTPGMKESVDATRKQMNDFVSLYRRNPKLVSALSFSTLYTAINTLAGHYASFGPNYPVPEKRRKRLEQQFNDIDRSLSRGR